MAECLPRGLSKDVLRAIGEICKDDNQFTCMLLQNPRKDICPVFVKLGAVAVAKLGKFIERRRGQDESVEDVKMRAAAIRILGYIGIPALCIARMH